MKNNSGRPILLKGKRLFVGAAIATLIIQPLQLPLSSGVAYAYTDEAIHEKSLVTELKDSLTKVTDDLGETLKLETPQVDDVALEAPDTIEDTKETASTEPIETASSVVSAPQLPAAFNMPFNTMPSQDSQQEDVDTTDEGDENYDTPVEVTASIDISSEISNGDRYSGQITATVTLSSDEDISDINHTITVTKGGEPVDIETSNDGSAVTFNTDSGDTGATYLVSYSGTYSTEGEEQETPVTKTEEVHVYNQPSLELRSPEDGVIIFSENVSIEVEARHSEEMNVTAYIYKEGESETHREVTLNRDGDIYSGNVTLESGNYTVNYTAFGTDEEYDGPENGREFTVDAHLPTAPVIEDPDSDIQLTRVPNFTLRWSESTTESNNTSVRGYEVHYQLTRNIQQGEWTSLPGTDATQKVIPLPEDASGVITVRVTAIDDRDRRVESEYVTYTFDNTPITLPGDGDGSTEPIVIPPPADELDETDEEELDLADEEVPDDETREEEADEVIAFSTGIAAMSDPYFSSIANNTPERNDRLSQTDTDNGNTDDEEDDNIMNSDETDEDGVVTLLGLRWYWWIAIIAGATALWGWVASRVRNNEDSKL